MNPAIVEYLAAFAREFLAVFSEMAPYLLIGFGLAGVVERLLPEEKVRRWLSGSNLGILRAALLGVPLPLCSCGVIPVALALHRRGASRAATATFLITTPMSGADSIAATWGMMGPQFTILRTLLTFASGLIAGATVRWICGPEDERPLTDTAVLPSHSGRLGWLAPGWDLLQSLSGWILVGVALSALLSVSVPDGAFASVGSTAGLFIMSVIGFPLYVCATSSIPLALEFVHKGFTPGAAFVFLLAGPATNVITGMIVWKELGLRTTLAYLGAIFVCAISGGAFIDAVGVDLVMDHGDHIHADSWSAISAWILAGLMLLSFGVRWRPRRKPEPGVATQILRVQGMTCEHCRKTVTQAIEGVPGARDVLVNLQAGEARFEGADPDAVRTAVRAAGFNTP
ncbi:MAG: permease [Planctomycetota bacterium]